MTGPVFTVLGEALLDVVQQGPGDAYRAMPAGGPLNIAVGLQRLGHPTALMARISAGALGQRVRRYAVDNGLDLSAAVASTDQATLAFATIDAAGRASYDFYVDATADWGWTAEELAQLPATTRIVHTGSLATAIEPGASAIAELWSARADESQLVLSYDPNIRPALAGARSSAVRRAEHFVSTSHVVKASDEDLGWLYPDADPAESARRWAGFGPRLVVLTRGPAGCLLFLPEGDDIELPAARTDVVDTIGAGDAFHAGLLSGLADGGFDSPKALAGLDAATAQEVAQRGLAIAALTCARPGADPPTRAIYESWAGAAR